ncbi:Imm52 family immunity protein [Mycobacterium sp. TY815]|uniref:Imm52 family immunity protein n=1 Tax=Mycobacterium TaxID=1763 RepID=UPI002740CC0F|nr:Imm52 family immunity protein [Mycobacterium sp. TY815]MDP7707556.1 hypothetical protein [Mycobacterium sp. TY815]
MSPNSYIGAYWGSRAASVDECAERLATLIEQFAHVDPLLTGWRQGAGSKLKAIEQPRVTSDHADLVTRLLAGRNRRDTDRLVIEELGYSVSWWNGNPDASIGLAVRCGQTSPYSTNSLVLNLPESDAIPDLYSPTTASKLLKIVIGIWQPDHAVWTNYELVDKQRQPDQRLENGGIISGQIIGYSSGWANFLSGSDSVKFDLGLLPVAATVERLGNGTLVTLGNDPANPPLADVFQVRKAMGYPVQPEPFKDLGAAQATPLGTAGAPGGFAAPAASGGQTDPRGTQTRSVPNPASSTDNNHSRDIRRGTAP